MYAYVCRVVFDDRFCDDDAHVSSADFFFSIVNKTSVHVQQIFNYRHCVE